MGTWAIFSILCREQISINVLMSSKTFFVLIVVFHIHVPYKKVFAQMYFGH